MKQITWDKFEEIEDTWEAVTKTFTVRQSVRQSGWNTFYERIFKCSEGKFYKIEWDHGSAQPTMIEVEPYEVTVTKYKVKK